MVRIPFLLMLLLLAACGSEERNATSEATVNADSSGAVALSSCGERPPEASDIGISTRLKVDGPVQSGHEAIGELTIRNEGSEAKVITTDLSGAGAAPVFDGNFIAAQSSLLVEVDYDLAVGEELTVPVNLGTSTCQDGFPPLPSGTYSVAAIFNVDGEIFSSSVQHVAYQSQ